MTSKLGYIPEQRDDIATNLQVDANAGVIYNSPAGFNLVSTIASAATATMTTRQMLGGFVIMAADNGGTALTTADADELVAGFNGVAVNSTFRLIVKNTGGTGAITMTAGTGITIPAENTVAIAADRTGEYMFVFTNVMPGSEAVTMYTIASDNTH